MDNLDRQVLQSMDKIDRQVLQSSLQDANAYPTGENSVWATNFDGLENILSRLPVLSMLQCRSVCKLWNETIRGWTFRRLWSNVNLMDDPWTVIVVEQENRDDRHLATGSAASILFYTGSECLVHVKELNLWQLLESRGHIFVPIFDRIRLSSSTAKGLFLYVHVNYSSSQLNIIILNPLTSSLRLVPLPPTASTVILTSRIVVEEIIHVDPHGPEDEGRQSYKVILICYHPLEGWKCYVHNSLTDTWMHYYFAPGSDTFHRYRDAIGDVGLEFFPVRSLPTVRWNPSDWDHGRIFHSALWLWFEEVDGIIRGYLDLVSFDADDDTCSSLRIPWSWHPDSVPSRLLLVIQRGNILVAPFLHLEEDVAAKRVSIKINALQIRYGGSEIYRDDEHWECWAVMPSELFQLLWSDDNENYECYTHVDDSADQILFLTKTKSHLQIVAYCFSPPSADEEWQSFSFLIGSDEDNRLVQLLGAPRTTLTMLSNFSFRLDSIP